MNTDAQYTCQWAGCGKRAVFRDKYGLGYCQDCVTEAAPYTCNPQKLICVHLCLPPIIGSVVKTRKQQKTN